MINHPNRSKKPVYRVFVENGKKGCHEISDFDELQDILSEHLPIPASTVNLTICRLRQS